MGRNALINTDFHCWNLVLEVGVQINIVQDEQFGVENFGSIVG